MTTLTTEQVVVEVTRPRWLVRSDVPDLTRINPLLTESAFLELTRQRYIIGQGIERESRIVAYCFYELRSKYFKILNLAVLPLYRRFGLGTQLLRFFEAKLASGPQTRREAWLDVQDDQLEAHLWLRAAGWRAKPLDRETYRFVYRRP